MNVIDEKKLEGGKKLVKYATTPIMSTYLLAFAIGELEYIQVFFTRCIYFSKIIFTVNILNKTALFLLILNTII